MKRRSNRDYFGPMTGFKGILHRTAMFLLYPLRKPLIFFPLLILLYLIPTFIGARPSEVHVWYWNKIKSAYNSAAGVVSDKVNPWFANKEEATPELGGKVLPERGIDQLVGMRQKAVRRQMFEKAKSASAPRQIGIGMVIAAVGFMLLAFGSFGLPTPAEVEANGIAESALVSPNWLISTYLVLTFAELFLSPMGISFVSKVAPPKYKGAMMGLWFVATAIGNYLVAIIGYLWGDMQLWMVWSVLIVCCLLSALFIFSIMKKLEKVAK